MHRYFAFVLVAVLGPPSVLLAGQPDFARLQAEGIGLLAGYLRLDTSNPPGRELPAADYLGSIFRREGIPYQILQSAPDRASVYARLRGDGTRRPILLLHHLDVVPAAGDGEWNHEPFGGTIRDGYIWGRGALDSKGLGIAHLMAFLSLKRSGLPLKRDVILLATADEEAGGRQGADWIFRTRPDLISDAQFVLGEGGVNQVKRGDLRYLGVEVAQKTPLWLRIQATGPAAHSSVPLWASASNRLIRALARIVNYQTPVQLTPAVAQYFRHLAGVQNGLVRDRFLRIEEVVREPDFVRSLAPSYQALLRDTVAVTALAGGEQTNVLPSRAAADLDCRLLPATEPNEFLEMLQVLSGDPSIQFEVLLAGKPHPASPVQSEVMEAIRRVSSRLDPDLVVGPAVSSGFTDSRFFRERGIASYGLDPFPSSDEETSGIHGPNERISIENFKFGIRFYYDLLALLAM